MGKLLFHGVHELSVPLWTPASGTLTSELDISQIVTDRLVSALHELRNVGCAHTQDTLPAVM